MENSRRNSGKNNFINRFLKGFVGAKKDINQLDRKIAKMENLDVKISKNMELLSKLNDFIVRTDINKMIDGLNEVDKRLEKIENSNINMNKDIIEIKSAINYIDEDLKNVKLENRAVISSKNILKEVLEDIKKENFDSKNQQINQYLYEIINNQVEVLTLNEEINNTKNKVDIINRENLLLVDNFQNLKDQVKDFNKSLPLLTNFQEEFLYYKEGVTSISKLIKDIDYKYEKLNNQKKFIGKLLLDFGMIEHKSWKIDDELKKITQLDKEYRTKLKKIDSNLNDFEKVKKEISDIYESVNYLKKYDLKLKNIKNDITEIMNLEETLRDLSAITKTYKSSVKQFENKKLMVAELTKETNNLSGQLQGLNDTVNKFKINIKFISDKEKIVKATSDYIRNISDKLERIHNLSNRMDIAFKKKNDIDSILKSVDAKIVKIEKKMSEFKEIEENIEKASVEFERINKKLKNISSL